MKSKYSHPFRRALGISAFAMISLGLPAAVQAASISLGPLPAGGATTQHEYQEDYAAWIVGDFSIDPIAPSPIAVSAGQFNGAWTQELVFGAGFSGLTNGDIFSIQELLTITGSGFSVNNLQTTILTPGWVWVDGSIFDNNSSLELAGLQIDYSGATASFTFDPLPDGTDIYFTPYVQYVGATGPATGLTIQVTSVPEPRAMALGMLGSVYLLLRKRR